MNEKNIIFGFHAVEAVLFKKPEKITHLYLQNHFANRKRQPQRVQKLLNILKEYAISFEFVSREVLDRLTKQGHHQGVVAQCSKAKIYTEHELKNILETIKVPPLLLILDGIQDPHNLGACLRTADAAGAHAVIAPKDKSVGLTPTVSKVACGAAETVPFVQVTNLARLMVSLKEQDIWLFGMTGEAEKTLFDENLKIPLAFILGNEEKGMRHLTREHCDVLLNIPMQGFVSSLNVSVATGVCLFEAVRQRRVRLIH